MFENEVFNFLLNKGVNAQGKRITDLWAYPLTKLEYTHNYIQWLFPTNEPSASNPFAPYLESNSIHDYSELTSDDIALMRKNILKSLDVMLNFYGYKRNRTDFYFATDFVKKSKNWLTRKNHNYLRITRILKSLHIFGLGKYAEGFLKVLEMTYNNNECVIGAETFSYWQNAKLIETN